MSNKISNIKERVLQIPELKGITKQIFFKKIGMTYGNFTGKSKETPLNSNAIGNIISIYPDINLVWLITGEGSKFVVDNKELKADDIIVSKLIKQLKPYLEKIELQDAVMTRILLELSDIKDNINR